MTTLQEAANTAQPVAMELPEATWANYSKLIGDVEAETGCGHGAWDCIPPEQLVRAVLKCARASASAAAVGEPRPITTAPKGRDLLLYSHRDGDWVVGDWGRYCRHNNPGFTYWAPLPATPPSAQAQEGGA